MFGAARALEARNELPEAIEQYRLVATKFPNTPEAKQALELAKALEEPVNVTFYKELYAYKPPASPGAGSGSLIPPGSTFGSGTGPGSSLDSILKNMLPPERPRRPHHPRPALSPRPRPPSPRSRSRSPKPPRPKRPSPKPPRPRRPNPNRQRSRHLPLLPRPRSLRRRQSNVLSPEFFVGLNATRAFRHPV